MNIEELAPIRFPLVNRFFKNNKHKGKAKGNERVFVLKNDQGDILAALRACPKSQGYLLRSVQVDQQHYRQGLGALLVKETARLLQPEPCWCYPLSHLRSFYESCGFQVSDTKQVKDDIRIPFLRYIQQRKKLLLMNNIH